MPFDGSNYDRHVSEVTNPVTELLERAWRLIDKPQKWCRGDVQSADGRRHCSLGALFSAAGPNSTHFSGGIGFTRYVVAVSCLRRAMASDIMRFNDGSSHREVAAAWQRAIALSRL